MTSPADRLPQAERNRRALETDHLLENLGERTINGSALGLGAQLIRMASQILGTFVLSRLLAPSDFGLMAMAGTVTALVTMFTNLGLWNATVQRKDVDQNMVSGFLFVGIAVAAVVALLAAACAPLAAQFFGDDRVSLLIISMLASLPIGALGAQHSALLARQMRWFTLQWIGLASQILGLLAAIALALFTDIGYWALVAQVWVASIVFSLLAWIVCPWRPSRVADWTNVRSSLSFGLNLTGFAFVNFFHRQFDNVLIGWRWGGIELGYYSRAYNLLLVPLNLVSGPLTSALVAGLSRVQDDPVRWRQAYLSGLSAVTFVSAGIAAILFGGSKIIVPFAFGPGWDEAQRIFAALAPNMLAATPMATTIWIYTSLGRAGRMLRWALFATPVYILSFLIGLPAGGFGLALSYTIAMNVLLLPCFWLATRDTNISLLDIIVVIAPPTAVAIMLGVGLALFCADAEVLAGFAAIVAAGLIYLSASVVMIVILPQYRSTKAIGFKLLKKVQQAAFSIRGARRRDG